MDERLLSYYNRELAYIRKAGAEFAEKHPKIASRLRLDQDNVEDPHVSRLIESFAFLTGRIRQTIDDSFPELTESLLGLMYPCYTAPLPSMSVIKCHAIPSVPDYQFINKGVELLVKTEEFGNCRFKTCDDIHVLPVQVSDVSFTPAPLIGPAISDSVRTNNNARAVLKIGVAPITNAKLENLNHGHLRFFISAQPQVAYRLLDYLANKCLGGCISGSNMAVNYSDIRAEDITFPNINMLAAGDLNEDGRVDLGYQALTDYFTFPQKYLFFDVAITPQAWQLDDEGIFLFLHFDDSHAELSQAVDKQTLHLGCTPIVNLYRDRTQVFDASNCIGEHKLVVDKTRHRFSDVYSIESVISYNAKGDTEKLTPLYGEHQRTGSDNKQIFWHCRRENSDAYEGFASKGTDAYLSLIDKDYNVIYSDQRWLVEASVICTNRDIPSKLPFGPDQPLFDFHDGGAGLRLKCLAPPTRTYRPQLNKATRWQLISQLSLQSFSGVDALTSLKTTLELYDLKQGKETRAAIDAITDITIRQCSQRVIIDGRASVCVGSRCTLVIDDTAFAGNSAFLFGKVLHQFFTSICAINSFVITEMHTHHSEEPVHQWPATLGTRDLL
ncbi:type VI secretion system baseplate subunit TssF [Halioxenophilus aromaticivorans]|uniref:Type VI secretion system baseplate subunit TssF n=1 Tax=Halioxenophilus aromaticivorans TaxID=1306992 RepID=A0AAV3U2Y6_9ALTE